MVNKKIIFISLITLLSPLIFYSSAAGQEISGSTTSSSDAPHIFVVECSTCPKDDHSPSYKYVSAMPIVVLTIPIITAKKENSMRNTMMYTVP